MSQKKRGSDTHKVPKGASSETATVRCGTSVGSFTMEFVRDWSPHGYDKAVSLFERGWFDRGPLFRVLEGWLVQFGISYTKDAALLDFAEIIVYDDPPPTPKIPFEPGTISFAGWGTNSRDSQLFISYDFDKDLGKSPWETPLGKVTSGLSTIKRFYSYGDPAPDGPGPDEDKIRDQGPSYIAKQFPKMANFQTCTVQRNPNGGDGSNLLVANKKKKNNKKERGSDTYKVPKGKSGEKSLITCGTTVGSFTMEFIRDWSPHGYDKAVTLFERGWFDNGPFFRVLEDWLVQFGISYTKDPELLDFAEIIVYDDPPQKPPISSFVRGTISFAGWGPNSRDSQLFISYGRDEGLGKSPWETPLGRVVEGMDSTVGKFHSYGDPAPDGPGPDEDKIREQGPNYIANNFPKMANFQTCRVRRILPAGGPETPLEVYGDDDNNDDDDNWVELDDEDENIGDEDEDIDDDEEVKDEEFDDKDEEFENEFEEIENDLEDEFEEIDEDELEDDDLEDEFDEEEEQMQRRRLTLVEDDLRTPPSSGFTIGAAHDYNVALPMGLFAVCLMLAMVLRRLARKRLSHIESEEIL